jgi:hypothetical protein
MRPKLKPTPYQVARVGEHLVAAEIHLRGGYAATFAGNMPGVDLLASDALRTRTVHLQVKTRTGRRWQSNIGHAHAHDPVEGEMTFWILVDLKPEQPEFYVVPNWWMENALYEDYQAFLNRHGGQRPLNPKSKHIAIRTELVMEWRDRWDLLGIFPGDAEL